MVYKDNAVRSLVVLFKKLQNQDEDTRKIPTAVLEQMLASIVENIISEATTRLTIQIKSNML